MANSRSLRLPGGRSRTSGSRSIAFPAARREVSRLLQLASNPEFLSDSAAVVRRAQELGAPILEDEATWATAWPEFAERCVRPFIRKWRALPLLDHGHIAPDPRRPAKLAILAGRWGIIPVFPWTGQEEIVSRLREIQRAIGKTKKVNDSRIAMARWLDMHGVPRSAIADAVWGRKLGLRRPTTGAAIRALSPDREAELMARFVGRGLPYEDAERAIYRRARGSEAPAVAQVRVAIARDRAASRRLTHELVEPEGREPIEPIARLVSDILRADFDRDPQLSQLIAELRRALVR